MPQEIDAAPEGFQLINKGRIFTPYWVEGALVKPAAIGGSTWPPSSFDPVSNRMFVCATDKMQPFTGGDRDNEPDWKAGQTFTGGAAFRTLDQTVFGTFTAIDVTTNGRVWQQRWNEMCYSGSAATAGGLVFVGRGDGYMTALRSSDGAQLWEFQTGAGVNAPPTVFEYEGREYIAVLSAGNLFGRSAKGDSLWLFALDGPLSPVEAPQTVASAATMENHGAAPPIAVPVSLSAADLRATRALFVRTCGGCHGLKGEGTNNGIPLSAARDGAKNASLIQQGRGQMPGFADTLSPTQIGRLAAYVVTLARPARRR